jgi:hypothetical protein
MKEPMNRTDETRRAAMWVFMFVVLAATVMLAFGLDLEPYKFVVGATVTVLLGGEVSNVGKRATSKPSVIDAEARARSVGPPE